MDDDNTECITGKGNEMTTEKEKIGYDYVMTKALMDLGKKRQFELLKEMAELRNQPSKQGEYANLLAEFKDTIEQIASVRDWYTVHLLESISSYSKRLHRLTITLVGLTVALVVLTGILAYLTRVLILKTP